MLLLMAYTPRFGRSSFRGNAHWWTLELDQGNWGPSALPWPGNECPAGHSHGGSHFQGCSLEKTVCYWHHLEGTCGWTTFGCCSVAQSRLTLCDPWTAALQASLSFTISWSLLKLTSIESVMPSNHLILCCPLPLLPFLASGSFPMSRLFESVVQCIKASASASVLPMNIQNWFPLRLTGLISLLSEGLSSLLQHHSSKALIFD